MLANPNRLTAMKTNFSFFLFSPYFFKRKESASLKT